jgi:hypothetical protein
MIAIISIVRRISFEYSLNTFEIVCVHSSKKIDEFKKNFTISFFKDTIEIINEYQFQENPGLGTVPPSRIPCSKKILLLHGDLCDTCRPDDEIVC